MPAKRKPVAPAKKKRGHPKVDTSPPPNTQDYVLAPHERLRHWKPGRPTEYDVEFCEHLINHMAEGFSFESFAAKVACGSSTLYQWTEAHAEFAEAKRIGKELNRAYWEGLSKQNSKTNVGNASGIRFNMINRFRGEWTDSHAVDVTTKGKELSNDTVIDLSKLNAEVLRELLKGNPDNGEAG